MSGFSIFLIHPFLLPGQDWTKIKGQELAGRQGELLILLMFLSGVLLQTRLYGCGDELVGVLESGMD